MTGGRHARDAPSILFIHTSFPAQFGELGLELARRGWRVTCATAARNVDAGGLAILPFAPHRAPNAGTHPYAQPMERAALHAQGFVRAAFGARRCGLRPDVIVAHSGWGAGMCARDVFPNAAFVAYCEWWYAHPGPDVAFLAEAGTPLPPRPAEAPMLERMRNAPIAMDIASADATLCPTRFQAAQFPASLAASIRIEHDGVDTDFFAPDPAERRSTLDGLVAPEARVVTYATRGMEPHRGFPQFMAALPRILAADPAAVAVIAGENRVAYGGDALRRTDWKAEAMRVHGLDPARVHFTGRLERPAFRRLLRRSDAHVYLTVPFVLSWSMLEAMSVGCALVLSDTVPVREFAGPDTARLADLRAPDTIAEAVLATLADSDGNADRRARARAAICAAIPLSRCIDRKERLFRSLLDAAPQATRSAGVAASRIA